MHGLEARHRVERAPVEPPGDRVLGQEAERGQALLRGPRMQGGRAAGDQLLLGRLRTAA